MNGGTTWTLQSSGTTNRLNGADCRSTSCYVIGDGGTILHGNIPGSEPGFITSAVASPSTVARGATENITVSVKSATTMSASVDVLISDPNASLAAEFAYEALPFTAGETKTLPISWTVPVNSVPGTYTVSIGVSSADWSVEYSWTDTAAQFVVQ
jgi:hypothetical protein